MKHEIGREICDSCFDLGIGHPREYYAIVSDDNNKIIWYDCGHVLIIKDGTVDSQYDYSKE